MLVFAHRGASGTAPENTSAAFREALRLGADGLELDVQRTVDGAVVVLHDKDVRRTSDGRGVASRMTLEALRNLDFGGWFDPRFRGERIPLLSEVAELVAGTGAWLNIELKGFPDPGPALVQAVADVVEGLCDPARTLFSSFHPDSVERMAERLPSFGRALLVERMDEAAWDRLSRTAPGGGPMYGFLHPDHRIVDSDLLRRAHGMGVRVQPWTLDRPGPLARMVRLGVDGVITGFPERVRRG